MWGIIGKHNPPPLLYNSDIKMWWDCLEVEKTRETQFGDRSLFYIPLFFCQEKLHPTLSCSAVKLYSAVQGVTMLVMIGDVCIEAIKNIRGANRRFSQLLNIDIGPALLLEWYKVKTDDGRHSHRTSSKFGLQIPCLRSGGISWWNIWKTNCCRGNGWF